jgi:hypothetical protein
LHCSRSCCARRLWTSRRRRIRPLWRSNQSLRPPRRTRSFPLLPSTSPHLGSSTWTPSSIRRKCRPRRLPYRQPQGQSTNWQKSRRTSHQREPREKPTHSPARAHHSSPTECSRRRSRRFRGMAVTEPFQQGVSRTDERAALSLRPPIARRHGAFVSRGRRARPSAAVPSAGPVNRLKGPSFATRISGRHFLLKLNDCPAPLSKFPGTRRELGPMRRWGEQRAACPEIPLRYGRGTLSAWGGNSPVIVRFDQC